MIAICAVQDKDFSRQALNLLENFGYEAQEVSDLESLESQMNTQEVSFVLCDLTPGNAIFDMAESYPKTTWIAHLTDIHGIEAASQICLKHHFFDYIPAAPAISNVYVAIWNARNHQPHHLCFESNGVHAHFQSQRASVMGAPDRLNENILDSFDPEQNGFRPGGQFCLENIHARYFRQTDHGMFSHSHFSSIFYGILSQHKTGRLHLWRPGIHWVIFFKDGHPFDIDMRTSRDAMDIFAWMVRKTPQRAADYSLTSDLLNAVQTRRDRIRKLNNHAAIFKEWLLDNLHEIFAWPQAEFQWMDGDIPPAEIYHPQLTDEDCFQILETGVFSWMPASNILDVSHSCLPYFLKLKDNGPLLPESFSTSGMKSVVEKLKIGDTMAEMLTEAESCDCVHPAIYLLVMMSNLELIS